MEKNQKGKYSSRRHAIVVFLSLLVPISIVTIGLFAVATLIIPLSGYNDLVPKQVEEVVRFPDGFATAVQVKPLVVNVTFFVPGRVIAAPQMKHPTWGPQNYWDVLYEADDGSLHSKIYDIHNVPALRTAMVNNVTWQKIK